MRHTLGSGVRRWLQGLLSPLDPHHCKCSQPVCVERINVGYSAIYTHMIMYNHNNKNETNTKWVNW